MEICEKNLYDNDVITKKMLEYLKNEEYSFVRIKVSPSGKGKLNESINVYYPLQEMKNGYILKSDFFYTQDTNTITREYYIQKEGKLIRVIDNCTFEKTADHCENNFIVTKIEGSIQLNEILCKYEKCFDKERI